MKIRHRENYLLRDGWSQIAAAEAGNAPMTDNCAVLQKRGRPREGTARKVRTQKTNGCPSMTK